MKYVCVADGIEFSSELQLVLRHGYSIQVAMIDNKIVFGRILEVSLLLSTLPNYVRVDITHYESGSFFENLHETVIVLVLQLGLGRKVNYPEPTLTKSYRL